MPKPRKSITIDRWVKRNQGKHFCQCGCGEPVPIRREHYRKSVGIPKFKKGHNFKHKEEAAPEPPPKQSLWDRLSPEERERRLSHLKSFEKGDKNPAWKGGRRVDEHGYVQLLMPDHPLAKDGYIYEHRYLVEEKTKKESPNHPLLTEVKGIKVLKPSAVVHHMDEVKTNNNTDNLMLLENQAAHAFIHNSPLPMEERLKRISLGIYHSRPLEEDPDDA